MTATCTEDAQRPARRRHPIWLPLLGFGVFFTALFAQFPLNDSLPGNCDTWLVLAYSNLYANALASQLTGEDMGAVLHPANNLSKFGESAFGTSLFYLVPKLMGLPDLVAYYFFLVMLFTLTGFGAYLACLQFTGGVPSALFAGFAFSAANFTFGNIDSPHTVFFFVAFLAVYFFGRFLRASRHRDLLAACGFAALQVYFSAYVFLLLVILLLISTAFHLRAVRAVGARTLAFASALVVVIVAPFFWFYFRSLTSDVLFNAWNLRALSEIHSLDPGDLRRKLPGNLYDRSGSLGTVGDIGRKARALIASGYEDYVDPLAPGYTYRHKRPPRENAGNIAYFSFVRRTAFVGFIIYLLALWGFLSKHRRRWELAILGLVGFIIALGPLVATRWGVFPAPMFPLYENFDVAGLFRVPSRSFFLTLWSLVVLAGIGLQRILDRFPEAWLRNSIAAGVMILFALENVPMPFDRFQAEPKPPADYLAFLEDQPVEGLLDLPSDVGALMIGDYEDIFEYNREAIYMNWQTYHRKRLFNGVNGYMPISRMKVQRLAHGLPGDSSLGALQRMGMSHITFHKDKVLFKEDLELLQELRDSPHLGLVFQSDKLVVFQVAGS